MLNIWTCMGLVIELTEKLYKEKNRRMEDSVTMLAIVNKETTG